MGESAPNYFWDSCVFHALLANDTASYDVASIAQFVEEAKEGKHRIFASTLVLAEVLPSIIADPSFGSIQDFAADLQGAIVLIDPMPPIMHAAAMLRDVPYSKNGAKSRRLSTTDAIMLASAIYARDALGVDLDCFHTFDEGKKRDPVDGKMIPLIGFELWCEGFSIEQKKVVEPVIKLKRAKPIHPAPKLPGT
jgi:predicted nucleic acid-binding protein